MVRTAPSRELCTLDSLADDPTPNSVGDQLTSEELSHVCDVLRPKLTQARGEGILNAYAIGSTLAESLHELAEERQKEGKRPYPAGFFATLAFYLQQQGYPVTDKFLRSCCHIVETISSDEIQQLVAMEPITMGHVCLLADVSDPERRQLLAEKTGSERLSTRDLMVEVKGINGPQRRAGAGRPPKISKNITAALQHIYGTAQKWQNLVDHSWFSDRFDAAAEIARVPPSQWTADKRVHVVNAIEALRRMAESAAEKATMLQEKLDDVDAILAAEEAETPSATPSEAGSAAAAEEAMV